MTGLSLNVGEKRVADVSLELQSPDQTVVVIDDTGLAHSDVNSAVDDFIDSPRIEQLPLNGRNFLELALLVPGNSPAPNFDPTKTNTVLISSAGQLGRGGNIKSTAPTTTTMWSAGPLQNITQEAVQEFQIATSRFTAESGRSATSVINVVTKSGTEQFHGSFRSSGATAAGSHCPPPSPRPSRDLPSTASSTPLAAGGPLDAQKRVLVRRAGVSQPGRRRPGGGARHGDADHQVGLFAAAPLDDLLGTFAGHRPDSTDMVMVRYAGERVDDTGASTLDRAIGSARSGRTAATATSPWPARGRASCRPRWST